MRQLDTAEGSREFNRLHLADSGGPERIEDTYERLRERGRGRAPSSRVESTRDPLKLPADFNHGLRRDHVLPDRQDDLESLKIYRDPYSRRCAQPDANIEARRDEHWFS